MMHQFLENNRAELVERCARKVAARVKRNASPLQLETGIPMFLDQLTRTLKAERNHDTAVSLAISGASKGDPHSLSEISKTAAAHGKELSRLNFSIDEVVHDYGDLCQSITDLAIERNEPISVDEFRTLNRSLDNAIADAVTEFSAQHDDLLLKNNFFESNKRLGLVMHDMRNLLGTASLAAEAMETGSLAAAGATSMVLRRSLNSALALITRALSNVEESAAQVSVQPIVFSLAEFIQEVEQAFKLEAVARGNSFKVAGVDAQLGMTGSRDILFLALGNLLQNAFKFTHQHSEVGLHAYALADRILIDVSDHCGGLPAGDAERLFKPFTQCSQDRSGVGLGLASARHDIEANGGTLSVRDIPSKGCVFTINLPRYTM